MYAIRSYYAAYDYLFGASSAPLETTTELVHLAASACLLGGMACLAPFFRSSQLSESALRASEERYRRMVDAAAEGIWLLDSGAATIFVNRRMAQMLGS